MLFYHILKDTDNALGNSSCQDRWHCIANLLILRILSSFKYKAVWECLQSGSLSNGNCTIQYRMNPHGFSHINNGSGWLIIFQTHIDCILCALCAWCSVPEDGKRVQGKEWQFQTDFSELHPEFPELVDADGVGWFLCHVLRTVDFMLTHPEKVRSTSLKYAEVIQSKFAAAWRSKVMQYQIPIFASQTKGAWTLRFDDVLADALELGPLRREGPELPPELTEKVTTALPKEIPSEVVCTLTRYYLANRQDDCEWVVLPVANFDAYFGDTSFSKKYLPKIPPEIMERSNAFGISRYRVTEEYLP